MSVSGLNNLMRYINPEIVNISGECDSNRCNYDKSYSSEKNNYHNLLYYTTISGENILYTNKDPSYNYFETTAWFKKTCRNIYKNILKYFNSDYINNYDEIYDQTHARTTWIYITPLNGVVESTLSTLSNITIPDNYIFKSIAPPQNIILEEYYKNYDNIFNKYKTPKLLSKDITTNFISPSIPSKYSNLINSKDIGISYTPTPSPLPFFNFLGWVKLSV